MSKPGSSSAGELSAGGVVAEGRDTLIMLRVPGPNEVLPAVLELSREVAVDMHTDEVVHAYIERFKKLFPERLFCVRLLNPEGGELSMVYATGRLRPDRRDRIELTREALLRHGVALTADDVMHCEFTRDGGYAAMAKLIDAGRRVECVFAVNDVMAVGAIACLRDRGLRVPADVAVAGFDDIPTLRDITPALTTVRLPLSDIGAAVAAMVLAPRADTPKLESIAATVVVRASTPVLAGRGAGPGRRSGASTR